MKTPAEERDQLEKAKVLHQLAVEMVIRLNVLLKSAKIYEPNNLLFQRQIGTLLVLIRRALTESGEAHFTVRQSTLFFNNLRLKYGYANYHFFKFVLQEFKKKEIGGIMFEPEVGEDDLKLFSKIVKITDFFDAITTKRVYRTNVFTRDEALSPMLEQSGKEFHPILLREFVKMMGIYPVGSLVALNTGELGIVVENNPETMLLLRPKVKLIADASGNKIDGDILDLSKAEPGTNTYTRTVVKSLDPEKYRIRVADYFLAQAE